MKATNNDHNGHGISQYKQIAMAQQHMQCDEIGEVMSLGYSYKAMYYFVGPTNKAANILVG